MLVDKNGIEIDINKIYMDVSANVRDIHIVMKDGEYYAQPIGLDAEPLTLVHKDLVIQE